jgi:hypothetical protein
MVAAAKDQPGRLPDLERQLRRDHAVGTAADAVSAEIFSNHDACLEYRSSIGVSD